MGADGGRGRGGGGGARHGQHAVLVHQESDFDIAVALISEKFDHMSTWPTSLSACNNLLASQKSLPYTLCYLFPARADNVHDNTMREPLYLRDIEITILHLYLLDTT